MKISAIVRPGDRIDMQLLYQVERKKNGEDIEVKLYKSNVYDCVSDSIIEIAMPTESGKMVLFQSGLRCEMIFYTNKGMYKVQAVVKKRYKEDNLYILIMELSEDPVKFQRREFFRISYIDDMKIYNATSEIVALETTEELFCAIHRPDSGIKPYAGKLLDISGGGIRFITSELEQAGSYHVVELRLVNDKIDEKFYLLCKIISSEYMKDMPGKVSNRAKFIYKDLKDRELIVRFVFEEERRIRKKVNG